MKKNDKSDPPCLGKYSFDPLTEGKYDLLTPYLLKKL